MSALQSGLPDRASIRHLAVLGGNLLPLGGVLFLGWDPATLAVVYAVELLVTFPFAAVKALFAGEPPAETDDEDGLESELTEKRGSVTVHEWLPPIYPRNVPFAVETIEMGAFGSVFIVVTLAEVVPIETLLFRPSVLGTIFTLVLGQLFDSWFSYVRTHRYAQIPPQAVSELPFRKSFFVIFLFMFIATGDDTGMWLVAGFVLTKLLADWAGLRSEDAGGGRITEFFSGPDSGRPQEPVIVPDRTPSAVVAVDRRSALAIALWRTVSKRAPFYVSTVSIVWLVWSSVVSGGELSGTATGVSVLCAVSLFAVLFGGRFLVLVLERYWLCYHRVDDQLVAVDRLTGDPQWTAPIDTIRNVGVDPTSLVDRLFDTRTITLTAGWGDASAKTIGPLDEPAEFLTAFDLDSETVALAPLNRWLAGAAVSSAVVILGGTVALLVLFPERTDYWFVVLFGFPLVVGVPKLCWYFAHPRDG